MADSSKNLNFPSINPDSNYIHACTRCGHLPKYDKKCCPAKHSICHKCHKNRHFKAVCRSTRQVKEVLVNEGSQEEFVGVIRYETDTLSSTETPWTTNLELNGRTLTSWLTLEKMLQLFLNKSTASIHPTADLQIYINIYFRISNYTAINI